MRTMPRPFSVYLDIVRFAAAVLVYLYHSNQRWLVAPILPLAHHGHSAVIVFFVLSGYVIAYITDTKERDWPTYAASRLSRVYSVALPAVLLTLALDSVGLIFAPDAYGYPYDAFAIRIAASLAMFNEVWFVSITSFSNVPYWSICYESWYYVGFGLAVFAPRRTAGGLIALIALALGPKIVILAPVWVLGAVLYRWRALYDISERRGWLMVVASVVGIGAYLGADMEHLAAAPLRAWLGEARFQELTFSRWVLSDYLLGPLVMLHFAGVRRVADRLRGLLLAIEAPVKTVAGYTFTLYLLHQPLFLFWGAVLRGDPHGYGNWLAVSALVAGSVAAIGSLTETRRHALTRWLRTRLWRVAAAVRRS